MQVPGLVTSWWGLGSGAGRVPAAPATRGKRASSKSSLPRVSAGTGRRLGGPGGVSLPRRAQRTSEKRPRTGALRAQSPVPNTKPAHGPVSLVPLRKDGAVLPLCGDSSRLHVPLSAWIDGPNRFTAAGVRSTALSIRFEKNVGLSATRISSHHSKVTSR